MVHHKGYTFNILLKDEGGSKMPTKKPRLNVVLEHEVYEILTNIAKKREFPYDFWPGI